MALGRPVANGLLSSLDPLATLETPTLQARQERWLAPLVLAALLFVPALLTYLFNASSFAVGTGGVLAMIGLAYVFGLIGRRSDDGLGITFAILICGVIGVHLLTVYFFRPLDLPRAAQSLVLLGVAIAILPIVRNLFFYAEGKALDNAAALARWAALAVMILSILGIQPPSGQFMPKPTFPFTEPSFLAFTFAPILIYTCVTAGNTGRIFWLGVTALTAVLVGNLTLVGLCLIASLTSLSVPRLAIALVAAGLIALQIDITQFQERLEFSTSSKNLTALVYVQGWQLVDESWRNSFGWGIGFQQLGATYTNVPASYQIFRMMGFDVNILDGGFVASKLLSEFGFVGAAMTAAIAVAAIWAGFVLRAVAKGRVILSRARVLAYSSIAGSVVEVFARGGGYFSGTTVLLGASLWYLISARYAQDREGAETSSPTLHPGDQQIPA